MYEQLDDLGLPVAMGYVPMTRFGKTFDPAAGLQNGTIFPDLCKPFCGKGGGGCK
ncbi:spore coat associated protein CotJA [Blautia liquoris]|uniref:Spore coat associated protein CotJA n=2 Tax=Blautia liquoris TaxID=2779518 RepID=A0A7M2RKT8_9FIRM|nr:spore coat associated protein CotJA [Blautia liquoris]